MDKKKEIPEGKDLATMYPEIARQWDDERNAPLTPKDVSYGSHRSVYWICRACDVPHSWEASVYSRTCQNNGCPICSGRKVLPGFNDLATKNPDVADEWDYERNAPLTPQMVTLRSGKLAWWHDDRGHRWLAAIRDRT